MQWGERGSAPGEFDNSRAIAVDPADGSVYVAERWNGRFQKFTASGNYVYERQLSSPRGVAVDAFGNVFVMDTSANKIYKYTSGGSLITQWGGLGSGDGQLANPNGIAVSNDGYVYVADTWNYRIAKFTSSGAFVTNWGEYGTGNGQFNFPRAVGAGPQGDVYVVDSGSSRIIKFTSNGTYQTHWGSYGSANGQFSSPYGICIDGAGAVYIVDTNNHRIQKFSKNGVFLTKWGSGGQGDGQFNYPKGATVRPNGDVYVADSENNRVEKFGANQASTGIGDDPAANRIRLTAPSPNPFNLRTQVAYRLEDSGQVRVRVYDFQGRLVRTVTDAYTAPGDHDAVWDGRDSSGRKAVPGVYFIRVETPGVAAARKVSLVP